MLAGFRSKATPGCAAGLGVLLRITRRSLCRIEPPAERMQRPCDVPGTKLSLGESGRDILQCVYVKGCLSPSASLTPQPSAKLDVCTFSTQPQPQLAKMNSALPPPSQSIETLESHLKTLQSLVQTISVIRHQTFPSLISNLQRPIQACDPQFNASTSADLSQVREYWKSDSQDLLDGLKNLRQQALNSQDAMKYIRATTQSNPNLTSENKRKAFQDTRLINEKTKQDALKAFKKRSSLSRKAKATGPIIEKHAIETELLRRKKLRLLKETRSSFPKISAPVSHLRDCIQRINRLDQDSDHLVFVSPNQILLKDVMRIFLVFKRAPHLSHKTDSNFVVERAFCFALTESPTNTFQRSSFGLIRSINKCINYHINQYLQSDRSQNPSNLWLVCSLLSSYKDFFRSDTNTIPRTPSYVNGNANRTNSTFLHHHLESIQAQQSRGALISQNRDHSSKESSQSFLTWRRWKLDPDCLDKLLVDDEPSSRKVNQEPQKDHSGDHASDDLGVLLNSGGHWAKIPEIN
ncbi:hypothetical protein PCANC_24002 [Puccinia coronata f. sp. avenae]|uniref:Uncharacterized protein n=2 Tax=Puccinia coronata f. sp. avenae TaxID=200324 RepID=A0A2N5TS82_9BASI|nr:hypothetical protein PCANC_27291 [Puccinia coronata f. sp. avenae]PLW28363.1 hypothetical protein PCANC_24002 [Puccinia coronata f. sp. avenae]